MIRIRNRVAEVLDMPMRWIYVSSLASVVLALSFLSTRHPATAAPAAQGMKPVPAASEAKGAKTVDNAGSVQGSAGARSIPDTTLAINSTQPLSQRIVHYEMDARYDAAKHTIDATEVLTYHNLTGQPLDHFPFHLYLNPFQPKSTWVRESKRDGSRDTTYDKWEDKQYGAEDIKSFEVVGQGDLTSQLQFIHTDDGHKDDKTVVDAHLPKAIAPGAYVQFKIAFHDQMPENQARSGWKRDFVLSGQWFPN